MNLIEKQRKDRIQRLHSGRADLLERLQRKKSPSPQLEMAYAYAMYARIEKHQLSPEAGTCDYFRKLARNYHEYAKPQNIYGDFQLQTEAEQFLSTENGREELIKAVRYYKENSAGPSMNPNDIYSLQCWAEHTLEKLGEYEAITQVHIATRSRLEPENKYGIEHFETLVKKSYEEEIRVCRGDPNMLWRKHCAEKLGMDNIVRYLDLREIAFLRKDKQFFGAATRLEQMGLEKKAKEMYNKVVEEANEVLEVPQPYQSIFNLSSRVPHNISEIQGAIHSLTDGVKAAEKLGLSEEADNFKQILLKENIQI
jgi:hypothetical protein